MFKLIATDLDGTLLGNNKAISDLNLKAIKEAESQGVRFVIASGRGYDGVLPVLHEHDLKCDCITGNGAQYIDENGKLISAKYLDPKIASQVLDLMKEHGIHLIIYTTSGYYGIEHRDIVAHEFALRGLKRFGYMRGETYEQVFEGIKHHGAYLLTKIDNYREFLKDKEIIKIEAFDKDEEKIQAFKPLLKEIPGIAYLSSFPDNVEVTNEDATKGKILLEACKYYGIDPDEAMTFGDGMNDLSMFTEFKNGVAVANAVDEIKAEAKYIIDSCFEDGVGKAINKYILNKE